MNMLMSGNCRLGVIGKPTELYDSDGIQLFVGDLVSLAVYNEDNPGEFQCYYGVEYVCDNEFQDDGLDVKTYVMGVASEHFEYQDGFKESIVYQNHKKWRIRKVKGFERLVNGERWGAVRAVIE